MTFLKAEWRKLVLANYLVDEKCLLPFLPAHTELDQFEGKTYVSLVGFMFLNTKVLGVKIPFHIHFEEVNLRFYVRHHNGKEWKRGVVFIKEIVPKYAITFVANTLYKEHYVTRPMSHLWSETGDVRSVEYGWKEGKSNQMISVEAKINPEPIIAGSEEEFITEHYWGYAKRKNKRTIEYEVTHPKWEHYPVSDYKVDVDFGLVYGSAFAFLNQQEPESVMLAEGSEITVENRRVIS